MSMAREQPSNPTVAAHGPPPQLSSTPRSSSTLRRPATTVGASSPTRAAPCNHERVRIELTRSGYLRVSYQTARRYFPNDTLVALRRDNELWLLPLRGPAAGGLLLKQRNVRGDRSVLIREIIAPTCDHVFDAFWDAQRGALRVVLGTCQ